MKQSQDETDAEMSHERKWGLEKPNLEQVLLKSEWGSVSA
jgi:hypothetical protein